MASFLVRMFHLTAGWDIDAFTDDDGTTHEQDINRLAHAGLTSGCTPTTFCPTANVRRDEMASFLVRAIPLTEGDGRNYFRDDDGTTHEADIDRTAAAGITTGCGTWRYCIADSVTRGQMAGFLHRVETPLTTRLPYPAPSGPLHVELTGSDTDNDCRTAATPCRTIRHALGLALDGDEIHVGAGTFNEEALVVSADLTITGDAGGATIIDASAGASTRVMTIAAGAVVTVDLLTITRGSGSTAAGISNLGSLTVMRSTISGNATTKYGGGGLTNEGTMWVFESTVTANSAVAEGGGIWNRGTLTVEASTISGNSASIGGSIADYSQLRVEKSLISGNTADVGGGISGELSGPAFITMSTVTDNTATARGGGLAFMGMGATIVDSTIADNSASDTGGGVYADGYLTLVHVTVSGNTAASTGGFYRADDTFMAVHLKNTVIVGNAAGDFHGAITSQLASIVGVPTGLTLADILDPAGLEDNGGPTPTIALTDSSTNPARGTADEAACFADPASGLDQRGYARTAPCDIGAYELQP